MVVGHLHSKACLALGGLGACPPENVCKRDALRLILNMISSENSKL